MFIKSIATALAAAMFGSFASATPGRGTMLSSWYGSYFHGRTTANGETYNMYGHTAAHKSLAFGTRLEVCYDGCVTVRINDRGPFIGPRELDLSYGAANAIGLIHAGVDYVSVTYI
jgi:rare lipoprotein A